MKKEVIEAVKALFSKHKLDPKEVFAEETQLAEAKLATGETITTEGEWAVGVSAMIVTEDEPMALPEGAYELEDGTPFTVDAEGVVLTWGAEEEEEEEMSAPLTEERVAEMIKEAVSVMTDEFSKIQEEANAKEDLKKELSEITTKLEQALSKPAEESTKKPLKVEIEKPFHQMTKAERRLHAFNKHKK